MEAAMWTAYAGMGETASARWSARRPVTKTAEIITTGGPTDRAIAAEEAADRGRKF